MSNSQQDDNKPIYLVVTPSFPKDGYWRYPFIYDFVCALKRTCPSVEVVVYSLDSTYATEDYIYQGVCVWGDRITGKTLSFRGAGWIPILPAYINSRRFISALRKHHLDFKRVRVVHTHLIGAYSLRTYFMKHHFPNAKHILQLHFPEPLFAIGSSDIKAPLRYLLIKWFFERMDLIVSVSDHVTTFLKTFPAAKSYPLAPNLALCQQRLKHFPTIRPKRIERLHNGVDTHQFNTINRTQHKGFVIGCIANFNVWKNQITLLQALNKIKGELQNWTLRLIGSGEYLDACKEYVKANGLEDYILFDTEVDHTQLPNFYRNLDLFVLPSYAEAFGCVFTEASACGTPFITCEGQGMDDFIDPEDRHLWLCKPKNPADLADKILHFYKARPLQRLTSPIEIDFLMKDFIQRINLPTIL